MYDSDAHEPFSHVVAALNASTGRVAETFRPLITVPVIGNTDVTTAAAEGVQRGALGPLDGGRGRVEGRRDALEAGGRVHAREQGTALVSS